MNKKHELIEQTLCKSLDEYEDKLRQGLKMEMKDYEILHHIYATLAKKETYQAMKEAAEYEDPNGGFSSEGQHGEMGNSGYRGRAMNGRYVSRNSYDDGYARGYSEAMNSSGHYPMPYYYGERRW